MTAMPNFTKITHEQALAGLLTGDLKTIPGICESSERWCVDESDFWEGCLDDAFLFKGLPSRVVEFGGCQHVLINPSEFDAFMDSICTEESA